MDKRERRLNILKRVPEEIKQEIREWREGKKLITELQDTTLVIITELEL